MLSHGHSFLTLDFVAVVGRSACLSSCAFCWLCVEDLHVSPRLPVFVSFILFGLDSDDGVAGVLFFLYVWFFPWGFPT